MSKRWPSELDICLDRENCWTPFPFSVKLIKLQGTRDTWKDIERTEIRGIGSLGPRSFFLRTKERKRGETRSLSAGLRLWFFFSFPFAVLIIPLPVLSIKKKKKRTSIKFRSIPRWTSRKVWKGLFLYLIKDRLCLPVLTEERFASVNRKTLSSSLPRGKPNCQTGGRERG